MRVMAQVAMVMNLDKCIGCHTCSVTCKNVWTSRPGVEYAWFNNVETKPGIGYPKEWENQDKWNGGWVRKANGSIEPRQGGKWKLLMKILSVSPFTSMIWSKYLSLHIFFALNPLCFFIAAIPLLCSASSSFPFNNLNLIFTLLIGSSTKYNPS